MIANSGRTLASSRLRIFFSSFLIVAVGIGIIGANASSRGIIQHVEHDALSASKIAPWVIQHTANGQQAEFFVVLAGQADLSGAAALATKIEKGRYVYDSLRNKSQATQGPILQWLRQRRIEHRRFYIVNAILVKSTRELAEALATRSDVARVEGNPHIRNDLPQPEAPAQGAAVSNQPPYPEELQKPETVEPNIIDTHAPDVWALGFRGQGITVGGADTGQRWTQNALKPHYRGWDGIAADHNYNWHDAIHDSVGNPCGKSDAHSQADA